MPPPRGRPWNSQCRTACWTLFDVFLLHPFFTTVPVHCVAGSPCISTGSPCTVWLVRGVDSPRTALENVRPPPILPPGCMGPSAKKGLVGVFLRVENVQNTPPAEGEVGPAPRGVIMTVKRCSPPPATPLTMLAAEGGGELPVLGARIVAPTVHCPCGRRPSQGGAGGPLVPRDR